MPPTPSMNSVPGVLRDRLAAEGDQLVEVDRSLFARGGEIGRQRRAEAPGRDALDLLGAHRPPSALSSTAGSLVSTTEGS